MRKSKEELNRIHKQKCKELKAIRARIAEDLGVDLHQRECTYEGYCSGTCPKCKQEELMLNAAILKKQLEESDMKRRVAAAGLTTVAALTLSGCNMKEIQQLDGDMMYIPKESEELTGAIALPDEEPETTESITNVESVVPAVEETVVELEGDIAYIEPEETEYELAGEIPLVEE